MCVLPLLFEITDRRNRRRIGRQRLPVPSTSLYSDALGVILSDNPVYEILMKERISLGEAVFCFLVKSGTSSKIFIRREQATAFYGKKNEQEQYDHGDYEFKNIIADILAVDKKYRDNENRNLGDGCHPGEKADGDKEAAQESQVGDDEGQDFCVL